MASLGKKNTGEAVSPVEIEEIVEDDVEVVETESSSTEEAQSSPPKSNLRRKMPIIAALLLGSSGLAAYAAFNNEINSLVATHLMKKKVGDLIYHDLDKYNANLINSYEGQTDVTLEGLSDFTQEIMLNAERGHVDNYQVPVLVDEYNQRSISNGLTRNQEHNSNAIIGKTMSQEEINTLSLEEKERIEGQSWDQQFLEHKLREGVYISAGTEARWANPSGEGTSYQSAPSTSRVLVTGGDIESSVSNTEMVGVSITDVGNTEGQNIQEEAMVPMGGFNPAILKFLPHGDKLSAAAELAGIGKPPPQPADTTTTETSQSDGTVQGVAEKALEGTNAGVVVGELGGDQGILKNVKDGNLTGVATNIGNIGSGVLDKTMLGVVAKEIIK